MRKAIVLLLPAMPLMLGGCVRTVASVVTFPVKAAAQGVDWATTSQDESDRNYGRKMRKQEAKEGRERKQAAERCRKHPDDEDACRYSGYRAGY